MRRAFINLPKPVVNITQPVVIIIDPFINCPVGVLNTGQSNNRVLHVIAEFVSRFINMHEIIFSMSANTIELFQSWLRAPPDDFHHPPFRLWHACCSPQHTKLDSRGVELRSPLHEG